MGIKKISLIVLSASIFGCANNPIASYNKTSTSRLNSIYNGDLDAAMVAADTNDILFNLEYGTLLRVNQKYESSNIYFNRGQEALNNWVYSWGSTTGGKVATATTAMIINDNVNDYDPRGYEKTYLPTLQALNYISLNDLSSARISIKNMYQTEQAIENYNQYLYNQAQEDAKSLSKDKQDSYLNTQIMKNYNYGDINTPEVLALKNSYQNAFSQYLAGFIFEALGEPDMARPSYLKAGQLQPKNKLIQQSIDNIDKRVKPKANFTDLLIVEEVGHAPQIKSKEVNIPINLNLTGQKDACVNMINVFYPEMVKSKNNISASNYSIDNNTLSPVLMADFNLMLARSLKDETPHIITRNVVAAARNIAVAQAACSAGGSLGSLLSLGTGLGSTLIDKADERNWTLLPSNVSINRTTLSYGDHEVSVSVGGNVYKKVIKLNQPYQVLTFRILGNKVFFDPQMSMN